MTRNPERTRSARRFAVLIAAVSAAALPFTGLAVHLSEDRGWSWTHTVIGAFFLVAAGWHTLVNRRAFVRYLRETIPSGAHLREEASPAVSNNARSRGTTTAHVTLDKSQCEACWRCVAECPRSVFGKVDVLGHRHAKVVSAESCTGCGRCIAICPAKALTRRTTA